MSKAVVKVILLHFAISLIRGPPVVSHSINRGHRTGPVPATVAMNEYWLIGGVIDQLEELSDGAVRGPRMIRHWNSIELHAGVLNLAGFIALTIRLKINNRFDTHRGQILVVVTAWLRAPIVSIVYAAKVAYANARTA
jgi:hypothetical protein